jgi:hypothetical protein
LYRVEDEEARKGGERLMTTEIVECRRMTSRRF